MSPVVNINSIKECETAYLRHLREGDFLSDEQVKEIESRWPGYTDIWENQAQDKVDYSSEDLSYNYDPDKYSEAQEKGWGVAKNATGFDGDMSLEITRGCADAGLSLAGTGAVVSNNFANHFGTDMQYICGSKNFKDLGFKEGAKGVEEGFESGSWSVAAPLAAATTILYFASKPNEEAVAACNDLQTEMAGAQGELGNLQSKMNQKQAEIIEMQEEATCINEESNEDIKEKKSTYDLAKSSLAALQAKIDSGEWLTDSEKELYNAARQQMIDTGMNINDISESTTDEVAGIREEIGESSSVIDDMSNDVAKIEGLTGYAESFDKTTQTMCYVEGAAQGLNALSGSTAGGKATAAAIASSGMNWWAIACAAMGFGAAAGSTVASTEQFNNAGLVGTEIAMRETTQDLTGVTEDCLDNTADVYNNNLEQVESLVMEIPEKLEAPECGELPANPIPDILMSNNETNKQEENPENNKKKNETE